MTTPRATLGPDEWVRGGPDTPNPSFIQYNLSQFNLIQNQGVGNKRRA